MENMYFGQYVDTCFQYISLADIFNHVLADETSALHLTLQIYETYDY